MKLERSGKQFDNGKFFHNPYILGLIYTPHFSNTAPGMVYSKVHLEEIINYSSVYGGWGKVRSGTVDTTQ